MNEVEDLCSLVSNGDLKAETVASALRSNFLSERIYVSCALFLSGVPLLIRG